MIVLGIECATSSGGVALVENGLLLGAVNFSTRTLYSQRLLPSLEWLLERVGVEHSRLSGIGISTGPGSFTGLRIGLSAAKGLAYGWKLPLVGIGTMEALALRAAAPRPGESLQVCTLLDARQGELFAGLFDVTASADATPTVTRLRAEHLPTCQPLADWITAPTIFAGDAVLKYRDQLQAVLGDRLIPASPLRMLPSAEEVALLAWHRLTRGESDNLLTLEPEYLRRSYMQP
jgi:tRNA threonylcarbamoyladenosine biosynthesis protein TsaB